MKTIKAKTVCITKTNRMFHIAYYKDVFPQFLKGVLDIQFVLTDATIVLDGNFVKIEGNLHDVKRFFGQETVSFEQHKDIINRVEKETKTVKIEKVFFVKDFLLFGNCNKYVKFNKSFWFIEDKPSTNNMEIVINETFFIHEGN
jgi:hypothetical protein